MEVEKKIIDGERAVRVSFGNWNANGCVFALAAVMIPCFFLRALASDMQKPQLSVATVLFIAVFSFVELSLIAGLVLAIFGHTTMVFKRSGGTRFKGIGSLGITKGFSLPSCGVVAKDYVVHPSGKRTVRVYRVILRLPYDRDAPRVIHSSESEEQIDCLLRITRDALAFIFDNAEDAQRIVATAPNASAASRDRALLAKPPKGVSVSHDSRKRTVVEYRKREWLPVVALFVLLGGLAAGFHVGMPTIWPILLICVFWPALGFCWALFSLFGKRTLSMEYGEGETFVGIGRFGFRKRFSYGSGVKVEIVESGLWIGNTPMDALSVTGNDIKPTKLCTTWPNNIKPFLAAALRAACEA